MPEVSSVEGSLWEEAKHAITMLKEVREPKVEDIFRQRYYIGPDDLTVKNFLRRRPLAAFNPGALEREGRLFIFPRLIFDYYSYASSIGEIEGLDIEEVINGKIRKPLDVRIILQPKELWEFDHGCEDPRVAFLDDRVYMLYTGAGRHYEGDHLITRPVQALAELSPNFEVRRKGYFSIINGEDRFIPASKDSAFLEVMGERGTMLTRPYFNGIALCWRAEADLRTLTMDLSTLKPVLTFEGWEQKVGWSTNAVKLGENQYLVGWHAVLKEDLSYRNGLAVVDAKGDLLAISNYLLVPSNLIESYGDRPLTILGDGLVRYKNHLIWLGGISDYGIGIFVTELEEALDKLNWIK